MSKKILYQLDEIKSIKLMVTPPHFSQFSPFQLHFFTDSMQTTYKYWNATVQYRKQWRHLEEAYVEARGLNDDVVIENSYRRPPREKCDIMTNSFRTTLNVELM